FHIQAHDRCATRRCAPNDCSVVVAPPEMLGPLLTSGIEELHPPARVRAYANSSRLPRTSSTSVSSSTSCASLSSPAFPFSSTTAFCVGLKGRGLGRTSISFVGAITVSPYPRAATAHRRIRCPGGCPAPQSQGTG